VLRINLPAGAFTVVGTEVSCDANVAYFPNPDMWPLTSGVNTNLLVNGKASLDSSNTFRVAQVGQQDFSASAWNGIRRQILNGFSTTFTFRVTGGANPEGFAFVIQGSSTAARGSSGGNLGYDFPFGLAIEFDMANSAGLDNVGQAVPHIEAHSRYETNVDNSASSASVPSGPTLAYTSSGTPFTIDSNPHTVRIVYTPSISRVGTGKILVYVDSVTAATVPKVSIDVDDNRLRLMLGGQTNAWVGFTGATSSNTANLTISNWLFNTVPISALRSFTNPTTIAGTASDVNSNPLTINARDACNSPMQIGGASITATWATNPGTGSFTAVSFAGSGIYSAQFGQTVAGTSTANILVSLVGPPLFSSLL
jgi:hypothetical protein